MNARFVGRADFVCRTALIGILLIILAFAVGCGGGKGRGAGMTSDVEGNTAISPVASRTVAIEQAIAEAKSYELPKDSPADPQIFEMLRKQFVEQLEARAQDLK